jgi:hypothetical protein
MKYKLKGPEKRTQSQAGYWLFVAFISSFMLYIMLIRPLTMPADKMPFIFEYDKKTHQVTDPAKQKRTYALLTGGAIVSALVLMIPVVINDRKHSRAMELLWANRHNIMHEDYMSLMDKLEYHVWRKGNADEVIADLQKLVDKYKGKDMRFKEYGIKFKTENNLEVADG